MKTVKKASELIHLKQAQKKSAVKKIPLLTQENKLAGFYRYYRDLKKQDLGFLLKKGNLKELI